MNAALASSAPTASSMLLVELNPEVLAAIKEGDADLAFKATDGGPAS